MPDQQLGTIAAIIRLNLTQLGADVALAKGLVGELGASMQTSAATFANSVGTGMAVAGAAVLAGLGMAVKAGSDWNQELLHISANTGMTQEATAQMQQVVEDIGRNTAAPLAQIAEGYMHVSNFGYKAAEATDILRIATQAAVATGGDASKVAEVLAGTLHNFGLATDQAGATMNVLRTAAARANATLTDFASAAGPAFATAHSYGISLAETAAALQVFTQHQYSASEGTTLFANLVEHVANPTRTTKKALQDLGLQHSELAKDMSYTGLQAKTVVGFLTDLEAAAKKTGKSAEELSHQLFRGRMGGTGTAVLAQNLREYAKAAKELQEIFDKGAQGIWQFDQANTSLAGQLEILKSNFTILAGEIEKAVLPTLSGLLSVVHGLVSAFIAAPPWLKQLTVLLAGMAGAALALGGVLIIGAASFAALSTAAVAAGTTLGAVAMAALPLIGWIAAIGVAVALLVVAWQSDFLRLRSTITGFIDWVRPFVELGWMATVQFVRNQWTIMVAAGQTAFAMLQILVSRVMDQIVSTIQGAVSAAITALNLLAPGAGNALVAVMPAITRVGVAASNTVDNVGRAVKLAHDTAKTIVDMAHAQDAVPGGGGGGGPKLPRLPGTDHGGGRGGGGNGAMEDLAEKAREAKRALNEVYNELYRLTHDDFANQKHDALQKFYEQRASGVPEKVNAEWLGRTYDKIDTQKATKLREDLAKVGPLANGAQEAISGLGAAIGGMYEIAAQKAREFVSETLDSTKALGTMFAKLHEEAMRLKASGGLSDLMQGFSFANLGGQAAGAIAQLNKQFEEGARVRWEMNHADYSDYLAVLNRKIQATRVYSEEWKRLYDQMGAVIKANVETADKDTEEQASTFQRIIRGMADTMTNVFEGAFQDLFTHGWKAFFQDVVKGFAQMLEQMLAQLLAKAAIFGLLNLLTGGAAGGILGSFGSFLGFDDAGNDRKAQRWGWDFGDMFSRGIKDFDSQRKPLQGVGGPTGANRAGDVHIHMDAVHVHNDMDIQTVASKLAWHLQHRGPVYQGTG